MFNHCILPPTLYSTYSDLSLRLKKSESWRGKTHPHDGFSKEDKEALNAFIFIILIPIFKKEKRINCDVNRFVIYFFKRLCSKAYLWDAKPTNKRYLKEHIEDFDEKKEDYVRTKLSKDLGKEFVNWLFEEANKIDSDTLKCFEVAKALATLIEFEELKNEMRPGHRNETKHGIYTELAKYSHEFPFIDEIVQETGEYYGMLIQLLQDISWARYTFRWQGYDSPVRCSILTHMLESAFLGYFMFIEKNINKLRNSTPEENPQLFEGLEKSFTVMLFHDIAEIWTDDIPSPAKDGMKIREITELQELEALNKYFYARTPYFVDEYFQNGVMLEDTKDEELKKFFKTADYFSADLEVWWNIRCGSREHRFHEIITDSYTKNYRTPIAKECLKNYKTVIDTLHFFE